MASRLKENSKSIPSSGEAPARRRTTVTIAPISGEARLIGEHIQNANLPSAKPLFAGVESRIFRSAIC